jgi:hypothetical protein
MKEKRNIRSMFYQTMQRDPHLACFITALSDIGIKTLTRNGMRILFYNNEKMGTTAILDPAKTTLLIQDKKQNTSFHIDIKLAIKITIDTFGNPELLEIPKIGTNLIPGLDFTDDTQEPKSIPLFHQTHHPKENPES